jgi:hypothetical protein
VPLVFGTDLPICPAALVPADHLLLLQKGRIVYQGPAYNALEHFADTGFPCPVSVLRVRQPCAAGCLIGMSRSAWQYLC